MCFPMQIIPGSGGGQGPQDDGSDPERVSETADVIGDRPDSMKPVQEIEDYYERRKRMRKLLAMREQGGGVNRMNLAYNPPNKRLKFSAGPGGMGTGGKGQARYELGTGK
jgi:hypothetical protein